MASFQNYFENLDRKFNEYIQKVSTRYNISIKDLKNFLSEMGETVKLDNKIIKTNKKGKKDKIESDQVCIGKIKSGPNKGNDCGKKVSDKSVTRKFCNRHLDNEQKHQDEELKGSLFRLNKFNNFAFSDTGLILKSKTEMYIIGKQLPDGTIQDLTLDDIEICKINKFKYCSNYSQKMINTQVKEKNKE